MTCSTSGTTVPVALITASIDPTSAEGFRAEVQAGVDRAADDGGEVVLDFTEVTFIDSTGLTVLIDIVVVFGFTKPMVTLLARTKFFGNGHPMSGLDPARLGAKTPLRSSVRRNQVRRRPDPASRSTASRNPGGS